VTALKLHKHAVDYLNYKNEPLVGLCWLIVMLLLLLWLQAAIKAGRLYVARTELNSGINSIFWAIYQVRNGLCSQNLTRR
jgi:hypothetical protein